MCRDAVDCPFWGVCGHEGFDCSGVLSEYFIDFVVDAHVC